MSKRLSKSGKKAGQRKTRKPPRKAREVSMWGRRFTVRVMKKAEARARSADMQADRAARLAALERQWNDPKGKDKDRALLAALIFLEPCVPAWVFKALKEKLTEPMLQEPPLHWGRWLLVREGQQHGLSLRKAY